MDLGTILDYCIEWNEVHSQKEEKQTGIRDATQEDIERYFG